MAGKFVPLSDEQICPPEPANESEAWTWAEIADMVRDDPARPGWIFLWDGEYPNEFTEADLAAVVAHELGHAATTTANFRRRNTYSAEWALEACADFYVYRWGFGRDCAIHRRRSDFKHHGPRPGEIITISCSDGSVVRYRMTRSFCLRPVRDPSS